MHKVHLLTLILLCAGPTAAAPAVDQWSTAAFRISCLEQPFLRISAFTWHWKSIPQVDLRLRDPAGRSAGSDSRDPKLTRVRYGKTAEIPSQANTKALHLEVCNAASGRYVLTIAEHGFEGYYLNVGADDGKAAALGPTLSLQPSPGRTCEYSFRLIMHKSILVVRWLDSDGSVLLARERPVCKPVLKG